MKVLLNCVLFVKNRGDNSDNFNVFFFLPDLRVTDFRFPDVRMNQGPVDAFSDQTSPTSLNLPITTSGDMVTETECNTRVTFESCSR
jgi:hypothetical protein